jgi:signal transduction histidine kinase
MLAAVVEHTVRACHADGAAIWVARDGHAWLRASSGLRHTPEPPSPIAIPGSSLVARAITERRTVAGTDAGAVLATPILDGGTALGAIVIHRARRAPFGAEATRRLEFLAEQAAVAVHGAGLEAERNARREELAAIAGILRAISGSRGKLVEILRTIAELAGRLCETPDAQIACVEDGEMRWLTERFKTGGPGLPIFTPTRASVPGRAVVDRCTVHVPDIVPMLDTEFPGARQVQERLGYRTVIATPLLHDGVPLGMIMLRRYEVRPFTPDQVALLEHFAAQAAIAIETTRLFEDVTQKSRALERASQYKSEFLANMSHELRTPLNAVIGFTEVLLEKYFGALNAKQEEYLADILTSGRHLLSLINDILDLSKIEAGKMDLDLTTFSLPELLDGALAMIRERATRHGIVLILDVAPDLGEIEADERKVKQVLLNLLSNAVKFTPDGGRIDVRARRTDRHVEVAVRDTGIGIAPEERAHVFEEFRQATGQTFRKSEGTGLGLALAKRFVELHGGTIRLDSEVGVGSAFTFTLGDRSSR